MKEFTIKITEVNKALINNFREVINKYYQQPIDKSYTHVKYAITNKDDTKEELYGCNLDEGLLISDEEFIRFYNEKMGINQSINYELW